MAGTGRSLYQLGFQCSPIILTNGLATAVPGGMIPIIAITESLNLVTGVLSGNLDVDLDSFFAQFSPATGTTLINNEVATYPFANMTVAANSIIAQPLRVSLVMSCPVRKTSGTIGNGGYYSKLAIMSALQTTLAAHNAAGGTYSVVTPSRIYTNCLMVSMVDVSGSNTRQRQVDWQIEFMQPLITATQAQSVQNNLMSVLSGQTKPNGALSWSGPGITSSSSGLSGSTGLPLGIGG